ncbi:MAG: metallophosphoesterase [Acetobacteraceae bacterium]|nr:metallophosphoesterase [Acetobacteraceae bacterium]
MNDGPVLFAGDPHRNFAPIRRACAANRPGTLVLLGDCECYKPLPVLLAPAFEAGWCVRWILGNRDTDTEQTFDNLVAAWPDGTLGGRVVEAGGLRIAGLSGVFKPRVWHPMENDPPAFKTREAFVGSLTATQRWRDGLPLWHRDTIFPEDFERLACERFDVLVTHEAPSTHRHGFAVVDQLATAGGAKLIVHGHHHESYDAVLPNGIAVKGLGLGEVWKPRRLGEDITAPSTPASVSPHRPAPLPPDRRSDTD